MKKALVERTAPEPAEREGWCTTVQTTEDILILNVYQEKELKARHCVNVKSGEYATVKGGIWKETQISDAYEEIGGYYRTEVELRKIWISEDGRRKIRESIPGRIPSYWKEFQKEYYLIEEWEKDYNREKREKREENRIRRVNEQMNKIQKEPEDLKEWIGKVVTGGTDFCIKNQVTGKMGCSGCGAQFDKKELRGEDGGRKVRNGDWVICPACKKKVRLRYRIQSLVMETKCVLMQPIENEGGVVRHFDVRITHSPNGKTVELDEAVRIILKRNGKYDIFYNQYWKDYRRNRGNPRLGEEFDNRGNRYNRRMGKGYLYGQGIAETLEGTRYQLWIPVFTLLARDGARMDYNGLMCAQEPEIIPLIEMLHKGRFWKLEREVSEQISYWNGTYMGDLFLDGNGIEEIFDIRDRQKINRIRENNGGIQMVEWMRWSEESHARISDRAMGWLLENKLYPKDMKWMKLRFSPEQMMNYTIRQKKEAYPKWSVKMVIEQYEDYMSMCEKLHKDTSDEMIYRPRELKRRHDEAIQEIREREAEIQAEEYSIKFREAEQVLQAVKKKLEYQGEKYLIRVPERIVEIVKEGRDLHHCAGSSERYFDRIKQQETYICFLRKTESPEKPYYTIEVEPGGTIRQHRGMYDEEPEIEEIRPFLREWQKIIRKRMTEQDRSLEKESAKRREENLRELREKNNSRVLQGLMEDFMGIAEEQEGKAN